MKLVQSLSKITELGKQFPILERKIHGKSLIYLDNAATTQKPGIVIDAIKEYYEQHNANIHRAVHTLSEESTLAYEHAHEAVAHFLNARSWREIIFTKNATESINLLAHSLGHGLKKGDEIIISIMEHHSNFVPWQQLAQQKGCTLHVIGLKDNKLDLEELKKRLNAKTKIVALTYVSNVLGIVNPVKEIIKLVHATTKAKVIIDAAQAVQHLPVNVQDMNGDFLVFTGHKLYGPTGIGVLYGTEELLEQLPPFMTGGDMIANVSVEKTTWNDLPWKFEAGTPPIAEAIALGKAVEFVQEVGLDNIQHQEHELMEYALNRMKDISGLTIYGSMNAHERVGVISFNVTGVHSHDLATLLDHEGIAIRSGHHCAQPLLNSLRIKDCARISFAPYNTKEEIDMFIAALQKAERVFQ